MHIRPVKFILPRDNAARKDIARALNDPSLARNLDLIKATDDAFVAAIDLPIAGARRSLILKARRIEAPLVRLKSLLGQGRAHRHARGVALLTRFKISTAPVVALLRAQIDGADHELLILERLAGPTLLEFMHDVHHALPAPSAGAQHAVAKAVGVQLAAFARSRLRNRDHKPSNILITRLDDDAATLAVIDTVAISRRVFPPTIAKMFASLVIEPLGMSVLPSRALRLRALIAFVNDLLGTKGDMLSFRDRRRIAWSIWRSVEKRVSAHGDPRPKDPPRLGPKRR